MSLKQQAKMKILIETCTDCPFLNDTHSTCELLPMIKGEHMSSDYYVAWDEIKGRVIPEWCPLKEEIVIIKLK